MSGRRSKAIACASCRRSKTRCEVLKPTLKRCHRCDVIGVSCSYEAAQGPPTPPPNPLDDSSPTSRIMRRFRKDDEPTFALPSPASDHTSPGSSTSSNTGSASTPWQPPVLLGIPNVSNPGKIRHMWAFIPQALDWSAPLVAIQTLAQQETVPTPPVAANDTALEDILSLLEIDRLLEMFQTTYTAWLNFTPLRGPFIDLVCCTIAMRHVGPTARLEKLVEERLARMVFNTTLVETLEAIQGLIILSLWHGDGNALIGIAANIAINSLFKEACAGVQKARAQGTPEHDLAALKDRARLWLVLANTESWLSMGTHRRPSSSRAQCDTTFYAATTPESPEEGQQFRIRLMGELFNVTQRGLSVKPAPASEFDPAYNQLNEALDELESLIRLILPLSVVCDHDRFNYHILQCIAHSCRTFVLQRGFYLAHASYGDRDLSQTPLWFLELKVNGKSILVEWGQQMIRSSEALLTTFLQCDSTGSLLGTCPDVLFTALGFAASVVIGMRIYAEERMGVDFRGPGKKLLQVTIATLERIALSENHSAMKIAKVIRMMLGIWMEQRKEFTQPAPNPSTGINGEIPAYMMDDLQFWNNLLASVPPHNDTSVL
ncbi:hypothetical protein CYLTODRAFT_178155 [Cylindrobasidium torrendii FP15055 ss-10]|uniref:Zn(2)-C6 fungal-type domain-containing protein n=1 Tax=Cylindrobasidium torrendii FP15055 ss-10 TaxID=1314674 RepID=A0A0D7AWM1_9AGAR|nr:hypothetical protein CYLTODRAFT_178155 [Cylindrobasidium torrendii FP15055 ss-10]